MVAFDVLGSRSQARAGTRLCPIVVRYVEHTEVARGLLEIKLGSTRQFPVRLRARARTAMAQRTWLQQDHENRFGSGGTTGIPKAAQAS